MDFSRRGFIGFLTAGSGSLIAGAKIPMVAAETPPPAPSPLTPMSVPLAVRRARLHHALQTRLGNDIYMSWLQRLELEGFDGETVTVSVPLKFLRIWIENHYVDDLLACCRAEFAGAQHVCVVLRKPLPPEELHKQMRAAQQALAARA